MRAFYRPRRPLRAHNFALRCSGHGKTRWPDDEPAAGGVPDFAGGAADEDHVAENERPACAASAWGCARGQGKTRKQDLERTT